MVNLVVCASVIGVPGLKVDVFVLEESAGDGEAVSGTEVQKMLAIVTAGSWQTKPPYAALPQLCLLTYFCIEIAHEQEEVRWWHIIEAVLQLMVEGKLLC